MTSRKSINNLSALRNPFEREIILEYEKLCQGIEKLNQTIVEMNTTDVITLIDQLRTMEKKVGLVYTLFRASAYSLNNTDNNNNVDDVDNVLSTGRVLFMT
ncbi:10198_t:CDS:2 [Entrophospora sp. SA101]|nr:10198_t:CDS:2 [Entrophospora sp. SA101]